MIRLGWIRDVTTTVLGAHRTPVEVGTAIGVGVFLGCTPFFGFHTLLAMAVSFLFGLNFMYVWLGTQISNPLFAGILTMGSVAVGSYRRHDAPSTVTRFSLDWLAGSAVVGSVLGAVAGGASYGAALRFRKRAAGTPPAVE